MAEVKETGRRQGRRQSGGSDVSHMPLVSGARGPGGEDPTDRGAVVSVHRHCRVRSSSIQRALRTSADKLNTPRTCAAICPGNTSISNVIL
jgi:hypothetical protein